ncbi:cobyric acid synthase [Alkalihalobacillus sp. AL-G]|uniref:cobyric acid synthase n=1 Tax=Alkalihalobacillus sp. AL-G TaxID=2926399 RepID=UPI00272C1B8D|nr:cobyric acid synthase [Alkalihalobacillus sp. AL-G]WLD91663.1 cobyric acid synthase [Alkalihalobacillus sp. AL-G]
MKGIMIQGTASDVGKSLIVTALCRILANEGAKVAPFKSQNMSNNSYVTITGEEIGRAQGIQAEAAKTEANVWMNPILLKPRSHQQSEVVLLGKALKSMSGHGYRDTFYERGIDVIQSALQKLEREFEIIIIEGAGSPAEINLKDRELVNMKVAEIANVPVILTADIDRGGVFASIVGTLDLLTPDERNRVKGLFINKFRGDISLLEEGIEWLEEKTGVPVLGVLPYIDQHGIDGEDSLSLQNQLKHHVKNEVDIAVIYLPFISNYSDIEPFSFEPDVSIRWVKDASEFGEPDAVIIPGTKSTINDLQYLKGLQIDSQLKKYVDAGGTIVGICGGYQMLGTEIIDEAGSDTGVKGHQIEGMDIIQAQTIFHPEKETVQVKGSYHPKTNLSTKRLVEGYEIHLGKTVLTQSGKSFLLMTDRREEGYYSNGGKVIGTYLHHLFHNDEWRNKWLNAIRRQKGLQQKEVNYAAHLREARYDQLADQIKKHLDWGQLKTIMDQWDPRI